MRINIGDRLIGDAQPCFVIAEAGVNHNGIIDIAKRLVEAAKQAGADAVKFQTFKSERIVTLSAEQAKYQTENIGKKESQYAMLKRLELSYDDFRELKKYCDSIGIIFLSTPHSCEEDVDLVAELCPAIKFGSGDVTNLPILRYAAKKGLPIILGTGMANLEEVREAVDVMIAFNKNLILLHCTTNYPTPLNEVNLMAMKTMERELRTIVGYSDHTEGVEVSAAAVALGAHVIEKHFTLDKNMPGPDHKASLEPHELKELVDGIREVEHRLALGETGAAVASELVAKDVFGDGVKRPTLSELETMKVVRKSVVANADIHTGIVVDEGMLAIKRPGTGLAPKYIWKLVGRKSSRTIKKDELVELDDFED